MKLIAYILLAFGSLCEFAGVYMIHLQIGRASCRERV